MSSTAQHLTIGTTVRVQPWKNGKRQPARKGVILARWDGQDEGWLVWFYAKNGGAIEPGETIQGFFVRELAEAVTGDLFDVPDRRLSAMEHTLNRNGRFATLGWQVHGVRQAKQAMREAAEAPAAAVR